MKKMIVASTVCILAACGGGGDSGNESNGATELEGTWVYASDGRRSGGACGLDVHGSPGLRITLKFAGNQYSARQEACIIFTGNQGSYIENKKGEGTFLIGDVYLASSIPSQQLKAIDLRVSPTFYTSYNLSGNLLKLAVPSQSADGSAPEKRSTQTGPSFDAGTRTLTETPVYTKL